MQNNPMNKAAATFAALTLEDNACEVWALAQLPAYPLAVALLTAEKLTAEEAAWVRACHHRPCRFDELNEQQKVAACWAQCTEGLYEEPVPPASVAQLATLVEECHSHFN